MVKRLLLLLLVFTGPACLAQGPEEDAIKLKNSREDLWYADSSFAQSSQHLNQEAEAKAKKRMRDTRILEKVATLLGYLIGGLILAALAYAFYYFTKNKIKSPPKKRLQKSDDPLIETVEDLYQTDFVSRIASAEASGNLRLALRFYYLRLLQEFTKQSLLRYEKNKTNKQYAEEIKNHKWGPDFYRATQYYNFVWYGEHALDKENYTHLVSHFKKMLPYE